MTCYEGIKYDRQFHDLQNELVWETYHALSKLRQILTEDPSTSEYEPPFWDGRERVKSYKVTVELGHLPSFCPPDLLVRKPQY